jgi:predicted DCC family thiol-disulfide oxidoreductase YuxK
MSAANLAVQDVPTQELFPELEGRLLVLYDGECGLCNRSIRWLLRRDRHDRLCFAPNSHPRAIEILAQHGIASSAGPNTIGLDTIGLDTIVVLRNVGTPLEDMLVRSNAVLACLRALPQPWPIVVAVLRLIPRPFRELGYRQIARFRYHFFGRLATCPIPTPEERRHFLEGPTSPGRLPQRN